MVRLTRKSEHATNEGPVYWESHPKNVKDRSSLLRRCRLDPNSWNIGQLVFPAVVKYNWCSFHRQLNKQIASIWSSAHPLYFNHFFKTWVNYISVRSCLLFEMTVCYSHWESFHRRKQIIVSYGDHLLYHAYSDHRLLQNQVVCLNTHHTNIHS